MEKVNICEKMCNFKREMKIQRQMEKVEMKNTVSEKKIFDSS